MAKIAIVLGSERYVAFLEGAAERGGHEIVAAATDADVVVVYNPESGAVREAASATSAPIVVVTSLGSPVPFMRDCFEEGASRVISATWSEEGALRGILEVLGGSVGS